MKRSPAELVLHLEPLLGRWARGDGTLAHDLADRRHQAVDAEPLERFLRFPDAHGLPVAVDFAGVVADQSWRRVFGDPRTDALVVVPCRFLRLLNLHPGHGALPS